MTAEPQGTAMTAEQEKQQERAARREQLMGSLPEPVKQQLALRQMANAVAAEIAGMTWGQNIGRDTARMLAEWGRRHNVDVTQEIDILGNKVYLNARFYLRRLGELIEAGQVEYAYADHINDDPRLEQLGEEGKAEAKRRLTERVKYNAPDKATAVVAFRVKLRALEQETVGVNWAGGGVRKSDPVGDTEPVKTAESRAARRCMRQLVSHVPALANDVEMVVSALPDIQERIQRDHDSVKPEPFRQIADGGYGEPEQSARCYGGPWDKQQVPAGADRVAMPGGYYARERNEDGYAYTWFPEQPEPSVSAQEAISAEEEGRLL